MSLTFNSVIQFSLSLSLFLKRRIKEQINRQYQSCTKSSVALLSFLSRDEGLVEIDLGGGATLNGE